MVADPLDRTGKAEERQTLKASLSSATGGDPAVERGGGGRDECKAGQREFELVASADPEADPRGALHAAAGPKGIYPEGGRLEVSDRVQAVIDRAIQAAMAKVLNEIDEQDFLKCSFGFRPGLGCHHALATGQRSSVPPEDGARSRGGYPGLFRKLEPTIGAHAFPGASNWR